MPGFLPVTFSSWDNGDALTQSELCVQASPTTVHGTFLLDRTSRPRYGEELVIILERTESAHVQASRVRIA